jgi:hypothetical protein
MPRKSTRPPEEKGEDSVSIDPADRHAGNVPTERRPRRLRTTVLMRGGKTHPEAAHMEKDPAELAASLAHRFHPVPGEAAEDYERLIDALAAHFQPSDAIAREVIVRLAHLHFDIKRTENVMSRLSMLSYVHEPEQWLKWHATHVSQRNCLLTASQHLISYLEKADAESEGDDYDFEPTSLDADGTRKEELRYWSLEKFSHLPNDPLNKAVEMIRYVGGGCELGQVVQLDEFMKGEFMRPEYGLGDHFRMMLRRYRHPLHHPFDPSRMKD